jgi:hypothetical protein
MPAVNALKHVLRAPVNMALMAKLAKSFNLDKTINKWRKKKRGKGKRRKKEKARK